MRLREIRINRDRIPDALYGGGLALFLLGVGKIGHTIYYNEPIGVSLGFGGMAFGGMIYAGGLFLDRHYKQRRVERTE